MQGNVLVLTGWSYRDALIQTYTLPYVALIREVLPPAYRITLVTSEQGGHALDAAAAAAINEQWAEKNMRLLIQPYQRFGWRKMIGALTDLQSLLRCIRREKIKTIHAFCTPAGAIGYLLSRITGARLVLDSFEPHAEAMVENGTWQKEGKAYRILNALEARQTRRASVVIGTTAGMKSYAMSRFGVDIKRFYVKPACVDLELFRPRLKDARLMRQLGLEGKTVCVYAGKLGGIYLKEEVFDFIRVCYEAWNGAFVFLMLSNATDEEIGDECRRAGVPEAAVVKRFVAHAEVPDYMALGDFGICPVKPVPTKRYCTPIKDGEYWALGLPVVIPQNISDDSGIIAQHGIGAVLPAFTGEAYRAATDTIKGLLAARPDTTARIREIAIRYRSINIAAEIYRHIYNSL